MPNNFKKTTLTPALSQRRGGFTLAEVLITLVIIGVIAAITVPTLMNKTNNQEYVSRLKKAYSTLSQVTNKIIADNGIPRGSDWTISVDSVYNMYKKYLVNAKECSHDSGCFSQKTYKFLNGDDNPDNFDEHWGWQKLILADGTQVMFHSASNECQGNSHCARIYVDINGVKKPNKYGRDLFVFALREQSLLPYGCGDNISDNCNAGDNHGHTCACKVLREGAMNY
ncbi:type II secretion system protein [bacterium]|nr:type II secretion system protein [bacterium]